MNLEQIGKFIAKCRKKKQLTQEQLAEKLNITAKAISKWETGKGLPDASIMKDLCNILGITVNELLSGELINKNNYDASVEENLLQIVRMKEESDKRLLSLEIVMGIIGILPLLISMIVIIIAPMEEWIQGLIILTSMIPLLIDLPFLIKIEQIAGYYECSSCGNRYVPEYKSVFMARHIGRTRYMKCPKCNKKSWNKKVISGGKND